MLPLEKDQECQEPNTVLETIPSTLTEGSTDLQTVGHAELTSMGSLPETRAHNIMKKVMTPSLYFLSRELIECDWTLELMKQPQASIKEGTATKYNKEWWANISMRMLEGEVSESELKTNMLAKSTAITKERVRLNLMKTPRKEVPPRRHQGEKKDATSSEDDNQTPKGGTVRKQRDANGDLIGEQGDGIEAKKLSLPPSTPAKKDAKAAKKAASAGADQARPTPLKQMLHNNNVVTAEAKAAMPPPLPRTTSTPAARTSPTPQEMASLLDFPTPKKDVSESASVPEPAEPAPKQSVTTMLKTVMSQMGSMATDVRDQMNEGMQALEIKQERKIQVVSDRLEHYQHATTEQMNNLTEQVGYLISASEEGRMRYVDEIEELASENQRLQDDELQRFIGQTRTSMRLHTDHDTKQQVYDSCGNEILVYEATRERVDLLNGFTVLQGIDKRVPMADAEQSSMMQYTWAHLFSDFKAGFIKLESLQDQNAREEKAKSMDKDKEKAWGGKKKVLTQQQWRRPAESNLFEHLSENDSDDEESAAVNEDKDMFESKEEEEESEELKLQANPTGLNPFASTDFLGGI